jgi:hypothetical protein
MAELDSAGRLASPWLRQAAEDSAVAAGSD